MLEVNLSLFYEYCVIQVHNKVQKFQAWHTKAAPNGKCCEGYIVLFEGHRVTGSQMWKVCWNRGKLYWKTAKFFHFCHLKKLVRPETLGPYRVFPYLKVSKWYSNLRRSGGIFNYELPDRRRCQICRCTGDWLLTLCCQTTADICWCPQYPVVFSSAYLTSPLCILSCPNLTNTIKSSQWNLCM
jgi:hypothetical protein